MFPSLIGTVVIAGIVGYAAEKSGCTRNGILPSIIICVGGAFLFYFVRIMFGIRIGSPGVDAILFDDPRNREISFQKLIGIGDASKIYRDLGTAIQEIDRPQNFAESIQNARERLTDLQARIASEKDEIGSGAFDPEGIVQLAIADLKGDHGDALV